MKKLWIPLSVALMLLAGCVPQPKATSLPTQPPGTDTAAVSSAPTSAQTPADTSGSAPGTSVAPATSGQKKDAWPSEIPASVPVFNYGTLVQTDKNGGEVTLVFSGVSKEDYADYRQRLVNAGFFLASEDIDPVGVSEFSMNGPNCVISLRVTKDDFAVWKYTPAG